MSHACGGTSALSYVCCNHSCCVRVGHVRTASSANARRWVHQWRVRECTPNIGPRYSPTVCMWYTSVWCACRGTRVPAPTILHERDASRSENREKSPRLASRSRHAHFFQNLPPTPRVTRDGLYERPLRPQLFFCFSSNRPLHARGHPKKKKKTLPSNKC